MFQVGLPCFLGLNSGRLVSTNFNKTRKQFSRSIHGAWMLPSFPYGNHCFQCQFLFSRCKLCFRYTTGNFNENPSMRALENFLRARASEHSSNFCEQFELCEHFQIGWDSSIPLAYIFTILFLRFLLTFSLFRLRGYIKHSRQCLIMTNFSNMHHLEGRQKYSVAFSTLLSVFWNFGEIRSIVFYILLIRIPRLKYAKVWEYFKEKPEAEILKRIQLCVLKISWYKCNTERVCN